MFKRRIGPPPHKNRRKTIAIKGCPDILELSDGDFAVIGIDMTETAQAHLPEDASCGPDERIVRVPRGTLVRARNDIPDSL